MAKKIDREMDNSLRFRVTYSYKLRRYLESKSKLSQKFFKSRNRRKVGVSI